MSEKVNKQVEECVRLNLGCGHDIRQGWINVDRKNLPGVDRIVDFNDGILPWDTSSVDYILCSHLLEHIHDLPMFQKGLARILKPGGTLEIIVPHYLSPDAWGDPEHCRAFSIQSFLPDFWPGFTGGRVYKESVRKLATKEDCVWLHATMTRKEEKKNECMGQSSGQSVSREPEDQERASKCNCSGGSSKCSHDG